MINVNNVYNVENDFLVHHFSPFIVTFLIRLSLLK